MVTDIGRALGRIPSGCVIVTARHGNRRTGLLASWVQQAGMEPPAVSVAVKKGRPIERLIDDARHFVLNVLGAEPTAILKHFGRGFTLEEDAFAGLRVEDVEGGVALADRIARLTCRVHGKHDAGDHWLYVGHVTAADATDAAPYVHIRKNGLNY